MTAPDHIPPGALAALKFGHRCLTDAVYRLDDAGLTCPALNRLTEQSAHLASRWQGRAGRVDPEAVPDWIANAAEKWRRERNRGGRRAA